MKWHFSNLGKNRDSPIIPKIIALVPTSNFKIFRGFVPKNSSKFTSPSPQIFPKESENPFPVPTLSPNIGDREGDFRVLRPHLDTLTFTNQSTFAEKNKMPRSHFFCNVVLFSREHCNQGCINWDECIKFKLCGSIKVFWLNFVTVFITFGGKLRPAEVCNPITQKVFEDLNLS